MKLAKTFFVLVAATVLWNCNGSTSPEANSGKSETIPATINALAKIAAVKANYVPQAPLKSENDALPFKKESLAALQNAGLCQGFIDLFEEISNITPYRYTGMDMQPYSPAPTPLLSKVVGCFEEKANQFSSEREMEQNILGIIEDCVCGGSGSLFSGFASTSFSKFGPPKLGEGYHTPTLGTGAPATSTPGGSGFTTDPKPAGSGFKNPDL